LIRDRTNADFSELCALATPKEFVIATLQHLSGTSLVAGLRDQGFVTAAYTDGGWMREEMGFAEGFIRARSDDSDDSLMK